MEKIKHERLGWPFFYSRTRAKDYSFLLLPKLLERDRRTTEHLQRTLVFKNLGELCRTSLEIDHRSLFLFYICKTARIDGATVFDDFGREILAIWGFISSSEVSNDQAKQVIANFEQQSLERSRIFWGQEKREPLITDACSLQTEDSIFSQEIGSETLDQPELTSPAYVHSRRLRRGVLFFLPVFLLFFGICVGYGYEHSHTIREHPMALVVENEGDGRWLAKLPELDIEAHGSTRTQAIAAVKALGLRVIADEIEHGKRLPDEANTFFSISERTHGARS